MKNMPTYGVMRCASVRIALTAPRYGGTSFRRAHARMASRSAHPVRSATARSQRPCARRASIASPLSPRSRSWCAVARRRAGSRLAPRTQPARRGEPGRERGIGGEHRRRRQPAFETRIQPPRHHVVVDHVGNGSGRGGRSADARRPLATRGGGFEQRGPEHRHGVVDRVAAGGVAQRGRIAPARAAAPEPMAGGISAGAGAARMAVAEGGDRRGG